MAESTTRTETLRPVISATAVDAAALPAYWLAHFGFAPMRTRLIVGLLWTAATLAVVLQALRSIREAGMRELLELRGP